jgi:hypothetical protein
LNESKIETALTKWSKRQGYILFTLWVAIVLLVFIPVCLWPKSSLWIRFSVIGALTVAVTVALKMNDNLTTKDIWDALEPGETYVWTEGRFGKYSGGTGKITIHR